MSLFPWVVMPPIDDPDDLYSNGQTLTSSSLPDLSSVEVPDNFQPSPYKDYDEIPNWIESLVHDNRQAQMAAAVQNQQWQESAAQKVMDFNADQARLNWERQSQANQIAMDFSAEQAQLNRDFINDQRSTAYQTAMADAKAAGLNPILVASQGGPGPVSGAIGAGVSTGGSAASMQSLPSGSKADTDITTLSHLISNVTSGAFQIGGDLIGILASILTKGKSKVVTGFR